MNNLVGLTGGPSKCARFYTEMVDCAKEAGRNDYLWKCKLEREDYLECLHNKKTVSIVFIFHKCLLNSLNFLILSQFLNLLFKYISEQCL